MPDFTTHVLFGEQLLAHMPDQARESAMAASSAYFWGTQGPDPLFYARDDKVHPSLRELGGLLHRQRISRLLEEMALAVREASPEEKPFLHAYLLGFAAHYVLDREIHPYVYFLVERRKKALPENCWPSIHCRVECHIDDLLYPRLKQGRLVQNFRPQAVCPLDDSQATLLSRLYRRLLENVYGQTASEEALAKSFRSCLQCTKLFYGPFRSVTAWLARFADRKAHCPGLYSCHVKGLLNGDDNDVLNLHQRPWWNLQGPKVPITLSVPQMLDRAVDQWLNLSSRLQALADGELDTLPELDASFDNGNPIPPDDSRWLDSQREATEALAAASE